jgi:RimJ/RimL family protein N-acetyltransferase
MLPGDRVAFGSFLRGLSREDLASRFGKPLDPASPVVERFLFGPGDETRDVVGAFEWGGELLGSANLCLSAAGVGEVALIVTEAARSRSVGRALVLQLVVAAGRRRFRQLEAYISPGNVVARRLAARCGFRLLGRDAGYLRFGLDV